MQEESLANTIPLRKHVAATPNPTKAKDIMGLKINLGIPTPMMKTRHRFFKMKSVIF
jgi:hypothetical protein